MRVSLFRWVEGKWDEVRGYLAEDLLLIQTGLNRLSSLLLNNDNTLKSSTIQGDPTDVPQYVSNEGLAPDGVTPAPEWAKVDVAEGVKNRLPFAHLVAAPRPAVLVGRESASAGDYEPIDLDPQTLEMVGTVLRTKPGGAPPGRRGSDGARGRIGVGIRGADGSPGPAGATGATGPVGIGIPGRSGGGGGRGRPLAPLLVTTPVTPGQYGSATQVAQPTVDQYGRVTQIANVPISIGGGTSASAVPIVVTTSQTVTTNTGMVIPQSLEIADGVRFEVEGGARTEITGPVQDYGWILLATQIASASASLNFLTRNAPGQSGPTFQSDFDEYALEILHVVPGTNAVTVLLRVSTDGATFVSSGYRWAQFKYNSVPSSASAGSASDVGMSLTATNVDNVASEGGVNGMLRLFNTRSSRARMIAVGKIMYPAGGDILQVSEFAGAYSTVTPVVGCQIVMSSGNIAEGIARLYGIMR